MQREFAASPLAATDPHIEPFGTADTQIPQTLLRNRPVIHCGRHLVLPTTRPDFALSIWAPLQCPFIVWVRPRARPRYSDGSGGSWVQGMFLPQYVHRCLLLLEHLAIMIGVQSAELPLATSRQKPM